MQGPEKKGETLQEMLRKKKGGKMLRKTQGPKKVADDKNDNRCRASHSPGCHDALATSTPCPAGLCADLAQRGSESVARHKATGGT